MWPFLKTNGDTRSAVIWRQISELLRFNFFRDYHERLGAGMADAGNTRFRHSGLPGYPGRDAWSETPGATPLAAASLTERPGFLGAAVSSAVRLIYSSEN